MGGPKFFQHADLGPLYFFLLLLYTIHVVDGGPHGAGINQAAKDRQMLPFYRQLKNAIAACIEAVCDTGVTHSVVRSAGGHYKVIAGAVEGALHTEKAS